MTEKQTQSVLCFRGDKAALHAVLTPEEGKQVLIPVEFVERSLVEHTGCGYIHFIPYVCLYAYDADKQSMVIAAYNRPGGMDGEEQLVGNTSFGFGGHVDNIDMILNYPDLQSHETEDGRTVYMVPAALLDAVCRQTLVKELTEEIGAPALALLQESDLGNTNATVMHIADSNDVGLRHIPMLYTFALPLDRLMGVMSTATPNEREIINLRLINIRLGDLVMSFNVAQEAQSLYKELYEGDLKVEQWSAAATQYIIQGVVGTLQATLTLNDLLGMSMQRQAEAAKAAQEQALAEASQAANVADATGTDLTEESIAEIDVTDGPVAASVDVSYESPAG